MAIVYKEESYQIIGLCMEVHNNLGPGFSEVVYKDALEVEFCRAGILYEREKEYEVVYKGIVLPHKYFADFIVFDKIVLEVKGRKELIDDDIAQCINYLKVSQNKLSILVNFGEPKLNYKRLVL